MTLTEQVYAQALMMSGALEEQDQSLLRLLSQGAVNCLTARLREGISPEDCKADFVAAASLLALAALAPARQDAQLGQVQVGDVALHRVGADPASRTLRNQAELIITPYLRDRFLFVGV